MSSLKEHEAEQAAITALWEATHCRILGCDEPTDDGEGYDSLCGTHADRGELVDRTAPRWAWELIDEAIATAIELGPDNLRTYGPANAAMILACELADDEPIYEDDPRIEVKAEVEEAAKEEERTFRNHYHCSDCDVSWDDEWSCACDDKCPECGTSYSPVSSEVVE